MKNKTYNALIIDDHPLISEAYKSAFKYVEQQNKGVSFDIKVAHNCDTAYTILKEHANLSMEIDIIFLDMRLPPSEDGTILSGEDLGLKIKELLPVKFHRIADEYHYQIQMQYFANSFLI
ncbi:hypothetical protein [Tenacibaculum maritimum]|uniref:hypothetical protein n=1 Tax=Tenacibaculum maritimum TaxID=107401 RepID=UPI00387759E6